MVVIKVVLVGMNNLFLQGLHRLLDETQFSIVGEASDLASWHALLREGLAPDIVPDLLLVDLNGCNASNLDDLRSVHAMLEDILSAQALPGLMDPDDVVSPYLFLASEQAASVTGQAYNVDRGEVMA